NLGSRPKGTRTRAGLAGPNDQSRCQAAMNKECFTMNYLDEQFRLKVGLAEMLKGGVIMDVVNAEQAVIAEKAGAVAVMALERVPSDIRKEGGVARMSPV